MYVYVDLLFIENCIINYLILYLGAKLTGLMYNKWLVLLASMLGATYTVLTAIFSFVPIWFSLPGKFCISVAMVLMAYLPESVGQFFKGTSCFYICSFVLAGAVMAIDSQYTRIIPAILIGVMLFLILIRYLRRGIAKENIVRLELFRDQEEPICVMALADTGCSLVDPISGTPAIILQDKTMKVPDDQVRLIPYSTVTDRGVLTGMKFQKAVVHWAKCTKEVLGPVVCPVERQLGGGRYRAIISADAFK
ncbi:MAG: sigma-E processing peptidase SpoIIGA [Clostridia bacterium]|nr:sigma-E processing peptidase SpoIIGA [Clostridia bacterium]